jgi:hypothetical protein
LGIRTKRECSPLPATGRRTPDRRPDAEARNELELFQHAASRTFFDCEASLPGNPPALPVPAQEAEALDEFASHRASSACPICGVDSPHGHAPEIAVADGDVYRGAVLRPAFERDAKQFIERHPGTRGGHVFGMDRFISSEFVDWTFHGRYRDDYVQALWEFWNHGRAFAFTESPHTRIPLKEGIAMTAPSAIGEQPDAPQKHVCGLQGFGRGRDGIFDVCPACSASSRSDTPAAPTVPETSNG